MTDENGGAAAEVVTTEAAPEAAVSSQQGRDYDAEARDQGWRPQEEWTGKPENWKDAKTYVEYGEVSAKVARAEKNFEDRLKKMEKVYKTSEALTKRQYEADFAALMAAQKEAAKAGDDKEFDRLEEVKQGLEKPEPETPADVNKAFAAKYDWYGSDEELTALAVGFSQDVLNAAKGEMTMDEMFDATAKKVRATAAYKAKFGTSTGANGHAPVDGGSDNPAGRPKGGKTFADLPAEAKRAYEGFDPRVKKEMPKEQYAKEYFDA